MPAADQDLASELKQARKKPRHFAIISKGSTVLRVIVGKKKIPNGDVSEAKKELDGNKVTRGVVKPGDTCDLTFMVSEAAETTDSKLQKFIKESAGMNLQVEFKIAPPGEDLDADQPDDDEPAAPKATPTATSSSATTPAATSATVATPAAQASGTPTAQADALAAEWKKASAAMTPAIQAAILAKGPNVAAVVKLLGEAVALSKPGGDAAKALEVLKQCHALATRQAEGPDPTLAFNKRLAALMPDIKAALATPIGSEVKAKFAQAGTLAQKKDFVPANEALDDIEKLLKPQAGPGADADEIRERIKDVQIQAASLPEPAKAQLQERAKQALAAMAQGGLEKLLVEVNALEDALASAASAARVAAASKQSGDAVSYRLLQGSWRDAQAQARSQLKKFVATFLADPEVQADPAFAELKSEVGAAEDLIPEFGDAIETALEAIDLAKDDASRSAARSAAQRVMDDYAATLESSEGLRELQSLSDDEYGGIAFFTELQQAVASLKNQLGAR